MIILAAIFLYAMAACAQNTSTKNRNLEVVKKNNVLVAYFSATGTTEIEAKLIAEITSGTLFEIAPLQPYTPADLDWNDKRSRSSVEMNDENSRPELKENISDPAQYDVVFVGYPIWWNLAPRIVNTFVESYGLKGEVVIPFATSGGSSIEHSVNVLKRTYPKVNWQDGRLLNGANKSVVTDWIKGLDIKIK